MIEGKAIGGKIPVVLLAASLALSGCAYVVSREVRREARKDLTFPMVLRDPEAHVGATVIWGGMIVRTRNLPDGTELVVLETPLRHGEVPEEPAESRGRFIARTSRYLDPAVFRKERMVTVAGEITGREARPLDEMLYTYPVIRLREIHLWRPPAYAPPGYPHRYWGRPWVGWPHLWWDGFWWNGYWGGWPYYW
jgi:outer membrane lipoprotein